MGPLAARCDAVCFGSLGQRSPASRATIQQFLAAMPVTSLRMFDVNLRQHFYSAELIRESLRLATAVKLNDEELPVLVSLLGLSGTGEREQCRDLAQSFGLSLVALTCGSRGAILIAGDSVSDGTPAPVKVVDTVGAGDSFTAAVVTGLLAGLALDDINARACAVAAYVCTQRGATPPLPRELTLPTLPTA